MLQNLLVLVRVKVGLRVYCGMVLFEVLFSTKVLTKKSLVFAKADCKLRSFNLNKRAENTLMAITGFNCRL